MFLQGLSQELSLSFEKLFERVASETGLAKSQIRDLFEQKDVKPPITAKKPEPVKLKISINAYGNYEHPASNLLFNKEKKVFGKQIGDQILLLTEADLDVCRSYSFSWVLDRVALPESEDPDDNEELVE